jgi:hypothetical protein
MSRRTIRWTEYVEYVVQEREFYRVLVEETLTRGDHLEDTSLNGEQQYKCCKIMGYNTWAWNRTRTSGRYL